MSKLDDLIREYCPNGVEYKLLEEILKIKNGSDYKSFDGGDIPVYGSGGIMAYVDRYNLPILILMPFLLAVYLNQSFSNDKKTIHIHNIRINYVIIIVLFFLLLIMLC